MSSLPFKQEKYRQYRNTFLQDVVVGFNFLASQVAKDEMNARFNDYAQRFFGVSNNGDLTTSVCNVSKKDLSLSFEFTDHSAIIHLNGQNYVSFSDTAIPQVFKIRDFFNKVVEIRSIKQAVIRKVNVFNIKAGEQTQVDATAVRQSLLSEALIGALNDNWLDETERDIPNFLKCEYQDGDVKVTIRTALLPPTTVQDKFHHFLLDTMAVCCPVEGIKVEEISDKLMDFNSIMYDCYHWCVSDQVKKVMLESIEK
jgi:uncharacterized protein (TIGR04255 family)